MDYGKGRKEIGLVSQWINEGQSQQGVLDTVRYFPIPFLWSVTSCNLLCMDWRL
jgi:hypothetical protein